MRRQDRRSRTRARSDRQPAIRTAPPGQRPPAGSGQRVWQAILALRLFLGGTFIYAGVDKLLSPTFLDPTSPASLQAQMTAFARTSPLGPLVRIGQPFAGPIGLGIAIVEIAIGLGALTGLLFRLAAVGGALLSALFFLTVSWTIHPFYYGPDLPFGVGWVALALAGHGGRFVPASVLALDEAPADPTRRVILQGGLLAIGAAAVASVTVPLRAAGLFGGAAADVPSLPPAETAPPGSIPVATVVDVERRGAFTFVVPFDSPAPLPAGDPAVIVRLGDGSFVAYDAICTHAGCTVRWEPTESVLLCPCHGAAFDPADSAAVLAGPTDQPLAAIPLFIETGTGRILLRVD